MSILVPIVIIALLVILNGVFVAAEFAIVGAPRSAVDRLAGRGIRAAIRVQKILRDPRSQDRYIATAQLGITLASLGLGMYGEHVLAEWIFHLLEPIGPVEWISVHAVASVLSVTILTYFHIVIGEMIPKSIALQHALATSLWITLPMLWLKLIFFPFIVALNGLGNLLLRAVGIVRAEAHSQYHTSEELQFIVKESEQSGLLRSEQGEVLRELFDFGDLTAGEVMVPRVRIIGLQVGLSREAILSIIDTSPHTRYPVYEENLDKICGVIHIKELMVLIHKNEPLGTHQLHRVPFVPYTASLPTVIAAMNEARTQMVVVMDEHGGTEGILTIEDLFEEIVGDIEEGTSMPDIRHVDGKLLVAGIVRIDELGSELGVHLEHPEVDTVSGLVLALLNRPASEGDSVEYCGVKIDVLATSGNGVGQAEATLIGEPPLPSDEE